MSITLDLAVCALVFIMVIISAKRGFIRASKSILALILTAVLFTSLQGAVMDFLQSSSLGEGIRQRVEESITKSYEKEQLPEDTDTTDTDTAVMICKSLGLPGFMAESLEDTVTQMSEIKNNVMDVIADAITMTILRVLSAILLFAIVRLFVFLILKIVESLFSLPGLKTINGTLGAAIGIINSLLIVYIVCGAVGLFSPMDKLPEIQQTIGNTYILKYFYENNLLISLFV